jgi:DNA-binding LytR/AlgR family response regulator
MKALIADDEPIARQILREHLEEIGGITIVGEAASGRETVAQISSSVPDVVFLDLQMPDLDGIAVARSLRGGTPAVVFVTAFDTQAVEAFNLGATDYLLKPVRRERLAAAIQRVKRQMRDRHAEPGSTKEPIRRAVGRTGSDYQMIDLSEVVAFQASGESVYILASSGKFLADHTLKALEERLPRPQFRRIHRGTIINTNHIRRISPLSSKRWLLRMSNGLETIVSKRMAGVIREETDW